MGFLQGERYCVYLKYDISLSLPESRLREIFP